MPFQIPLPSVSSTGFAILFRSATFPFNESTSTSGEQDTGGGGGISPPSFGALLLENGFYLLLEDGSKLLLE